MPFTQRSDDVNKDKVCSTADDSAEGRCISDKAKTTSKENETGLTPAVKMQRLTNFEDENELETVEIISLNSGGQQLGSDTITELYVVQGKTFLICQLNQIRSNATDLLSRVLCINFTTCATF